MTLLLEEHVALDAGGFEVEIGKFQKAYSFERHTPLPHPNLDSPAWPVGLRRNGGGSLSFQIP